MGPVDTVDISLQVENTGSCPGEEVVQLYIRDVYASKTRPVKELAGFKRIALNVGEKKTVCFHLECSQTAFLDSHMDWKVEAGDMEVQVGSSSEDIRLKGGFTITQSRIVDGRTRGMFALAEVVSICNETSK